MALSGYVASELSRENQHIPKDSYSIEYRLLILGYLGSPGTHVLKFFSSSDFLDFLVLVNRVMMSSDFRGPGLI